MELFDKILLKHTLTTTYNYPELKRAIKEIIMVYTEKEIIKMKTELSDVMIQELLKKIYDESLRGLFIKIIIKRINDFSPEFNKYEINQLTEALHTIKQLIPPSYFNQTGIPEQLINTDSEKDNELQDIIYDLERGKITKMNAILQIKKLMK